MTAAIEIRGVNKSFGPKVAVRDMTFTIPQGSLIGLIGRNGAGKTTTIRMVMSIIFPDSGEISVLGKKSAVESKDRIGYLPEERGLYKKMKVNTFLTYVARLKGIDSVGLDKRVRAWLERVELLGSAKKKCEELSKGMQQKVQFIASVIHEPDLIILDEPFSGLDPVNARLLSSLVDEQHKAGRTVIFSTHQMSQAEAVCDRVIMVNDGTKVLDDTPQGIRSRFDPKTVEAAPLHPLSDEELANLPRLPGVRDVSRKDDSLLFALDGRESAEQVLARIVQAMPVSSIKIVRPSLEDVFLEIVLKAAKTPEERERLMALAGEWGGGGSSGD
ncbi:MAG: ATP-binding cassette domain-containing protein [Phycisphaerales bacterium]